MKFQTQIPMKPGNNLLDYNSGIVLLGSCFVEHMGEKLRYFKFRELQNPFGILFHPAAIANLTERIKTGQAYTEGDIFQHNGRWHCFDTHSDRSGNTPGEVVTGINKTIANASDYLRTATHVIITLGTAWGYRLNETGILVANCHKVPQSRFSKELASVTAIEEDIIRIRENLRAVNPGIHLIFTISPVRHLKDGFVENQRSKAHLITALHRVLEEDTYFPSYEIVMDELRDYRFYAEDMIHPGKTAIDYIWEKFTQNYISPEAVPVMKEVDAIRKGRSHRAFAPDSEQHLRFLDQLQRRIEALRKKVPHISF